MKKILLSFTLFFVCFIFQINAQNKKNSETDREYWANLAYKISAPVLSNMSKGELSKNMEVEVSPTWDGRDKRVTYMECFGRLMAG